MHTCSAGPARLRPPSQLTTAPIGFSAPPLPTSYLPRGAYIGFCQFDGSSTLIHHTPTKVNEYDTPPLRIHTQALPRSIYFGPTRLGERNVQHLDV